MHFFLSRFVLFYFRLSFCFTWKVTDINSRRQRKRVSANERESEKKTTYWNQLKHVTFVVLICVSDKKWWKRMKNQAHKLMCACTVLIYGCHYRYLAVIQKASRIFARISFFMSIYLFVCSLLVHRVGFSHCTKWTLTLFALPK